MTEQLVTFETAKLAKEKGFDAKCRDAFEWYVFENKTFGPTELKLESSAMHCYSPGDRHEMPVETLKRLAFVEKFMRDQYFNSSLPPWLYARPTQDLLEGWLRKAHNQGIIVHPTIYGGYTYKLLFMRDRVRNEFGVNSVIDDQGPYKTHEIAREQALVYALKLLPDIA